MGVISVKGCASTNAATSRDSAPAAGFRPITSDGLSRDAMVSAGSASDSPDVSTSRVKSMPPYGFGAAAPGDVAQSGAIGAAGGVGPG